MNRSFNRRRVTEMKVVILISVYKQLYTECRRVQIVCRSYEQC